MLKSPLVIAAAAVGLNALFALSANAADGTINFNGELVSQTCTIAVDGVVSPAVASVTLPTVSTGSLVSAGQVAGQTEFEIKLSKCSGTAKTASSFFEGGATVDPISGNLNNMTGSATNVQLQLVDAENGSAIKAGNVSQRTNTAKIAIDGSGDAYMPYSVQYFANAATTAGTVISSVTYSVDYQ